MLVGHPIAVIALLGSREGTGFLAGPAVAQPSEFSIMFLAALFTRGRVDVGALGVLILVRLVTLTLSNGMVLYFERRHAGCARWLGVSGRRQRLIGFLRTCGSLGRVAVTARDKVDAAPLYHARAARVLLPLNDAADDVAREIARRLQLDAATP